MPDWSYRTVFQPLLFALPAETARDLALGAMGRLSRFPLGPTIIDLMGHMRPDPRLAQSLQGLSSPGPVGIGHRVDPHGAASAALARFGVGFLELGPIAVRRLQPSRPVQRRIESKSIWVAGEPAADSLEDWVERLKTGQAGAARTLARLTIAAGTPPDQATAECVLMCGQLAPLVDGIVLDTADEALRAGWSPDDWQRHVRSVVESCRAGLEGRAWLAIRADLNADELAATAEVACQAGCRGILVEGRRADPEGGFLIGPDSLASVRQTVRRLRERCGAPLSVIAGGAHEPADAIALRRDGADGVVLESGLVYSGPGLPKRINEAVLFADAPPQDAVPAAALQKSTWFWTLILGASMLLGGLMAFGIATTRVILPYDEVFVGMSRDEMNLINPRLLAFMRHDRVTLSGTMIAVAVLYLYLSWYGVRQGIHWAMVAILVSAFAGFTSFFLFLGFGYFDPFHAFVTTVLLQFTLMAWQGTLGPPRAAACPNLYESPAWRSAQWGQLSFVIHGAVLVCAGAIISGVGCTSVFVREDLEFMDVCPSDLTLANPRLIPLIAHDRASFGGMLIATGLAVLLTSLWGFREGAGWQWWMLLLAGVPAYAAAIGVHQAVGYTSWWHLAPAYGGLGLLLTGLALLRPFLNRDVATGQAEWNRLRAAD